MDTIEELNGTYFFNGMNNLTKWELLLWVLIDETGKQLGIHDIVGIASLILGNNIIDIPGKPVTATTGTSPASLFFRRHIRYKFQKRVLPTLTKKSFSVKGIKIFWVRNLGAFAGRSVPVLGWGILAHDVTVISYRTVARYNLIAHKEDRIW